MAVKQKLAYTCDFCNAEMDQPVITTEDVANEGCSRICLEKRVFEVGGQHYCSFSCLLDDIRKHLDSGLPGMKAKEPGKKKGTK